VDVGGDGMDGAKSGGTYFQFVVLFNLLDHVFMIKSNMR
jgi:hypothetical protein